MTERILSPLRLPVSPRSRQCFQRLFPDRCKSEPGNGWETPGASGSPSPEKVPNPHFGSDPAKRDLRRLLVPRRWEPNSLVVSDLAEILDFAADRLVMKGDSDLVDFVQSLRERAKIARAMAADHGFSKQ